MRVHRRSSGMRRRAYRNYYVPPQAHEEPARRRRKRRRMPPTRRRKARRRRIIRQAARLSAIAAMMLIMAVSAANLAEYAADYIMARRASDMLRESYYEETDALQAEEVPTSAAPASTGAPPAQQIGIILPEDTVPPAQSALQQEGYAVLEPKPYPANPQATVRERFVKLRRQNKDIVGWLKIDDMLDEAVVKRDNAYYLGRDYRGYHNANGAIFMDENCSLKTRPYTVMLFGHNMKTGLMFGRLRDYENIRFYREHPFITFDTAYENGRYVVFAAATIGLEPDRKNYLDLAGLLGDEVGRRTRAISRLKALSVHTAMIEVEAQDQILLLITCVEDDMERRVIAARRVRVGEDEEQLARWVQQVDPK